MGAFDDLIPKQGAFDDLIPKKQFDTELTFGEKAVRSLPQIFQDALTGVAGGNLRGSAVGRVMQGMADPGVAAVQLGANAIGMGDSVNKGIQDTEAQYQTARGEAGSTNFDPLRMAGNVAITAPLAGVGGAASGLAGTIGRGVAMGGGFAALEPITNGGGTYWQDKLKQVGTGAVVGGIAAPLMTGLAKVVSPSVNPNVKTLQNEGVPMSPGQAAGGFLNSVEEKLQSIPVLGDAIRAGRQRGGESLERAAFARAGDPIGVTIKDVGHEGITELKNALGKSYDNVIPKMSVDALDPVFVQKLSNLRTMAQSLPPQEAQQFDNVLSRVFDARLAPNGRLSGQNLKDAWNALRDEGALYAKSNDAYQAKLGGAIKQTFQELKDLVGTSNPADVVAQLKNTDFGYANYKILQRAASGASAVDGRITPSALQGAVRASDRSIDKGRMAEGRALMQDLSNAGKDVLTNKVPNSGTVDRAMTGSIAGLGLGAMLSPLGLAYTPTVQNALVALMTKRPDMAPQIANYLRLMTPAVTAGAVPTYLQNKQ